MIIKYDIETATNHSIYNKQAIDKIRTGSCYFCFRYCLVTDIEETGDKGRTYLCPHCGIDSLLPGVVELSNLEAIHNKWFVPVSDR